MYYSVDYSAFILWFDHFLDSGAEICQIFRCFHQKDILKLFDLYYKMEYQYQHCLGQGQSNYKELIEILTDSSTHLAYLVFTSPLFFFHGFST